MKDRSSHEHSLELVWFPDPSCMGGVKEGSGNQTSLEPLAWNRWFQNLPALSSVYENRITPIIITDITGTSEDVTNIYKIRIPALGCGMGLRTIQAAHRSNWIRTQRRCLNYLWNWFLLQCCWRRVDMLRTSVPFSPRSLSMPAKDRKLLFIAPWLVQIHFSGELIMKYSRVWKTIVELGSHNQWQWRAFLVASSQILPYKQLWKMMGRWCSVLHQWYLGAMCLVALPLIMCKVVL